MVAFRYTYSQRLWMEIEFQLRRRFPAGWRILPILQRLFDRVYEHRVTADEGLIFDSSIRRDHDLHFDRAHQAHSLGDFGVRRNWIGKYLAALLRLQIRHAQAQGHRQQRTAQDSSLTLVSHFNFSF